VRCSFFSNSFGEGFFLEQVLGGEVALPAGDRLEPFVNADDVANVAVAALTQVGHEGQLYELAGRRLLTFAEAVGEISRASGREIRYVPVSAEGFASELSQDGVPSEVADAEQRVGGRERPSDRAPTFEKTAALLERGVVPL